MSRELEHNLRSLEILFTLAFNKARQHNLSNAYKVYEKNYEKIIQVCNLIKARQTLIRIFAF
jgi:alpha-mannosidase